MEYAIGAPVAAILTLFLAFAMNIVKGPKPVVNEGEVPGLTGIPRDRCHDPIDE